MNKRYVVIGGVAAGMSAASRIKRLKPESEVIVFEKGPFVSTSTCSLPYFISDSRMTKENMIVLSAENAEKERGIKVLVHHEVVGIFPNEKRVFFKNILSGKEKSLDYDRLIIAAGAKPVIPEIEGVIQKHVFSLRNLSDAERIKNFIIQHNPENAVIIGGGYVGLEMAETFRKCHIKPSIVEKMALPLPGFSNTIRKEIIEILKANQVNLITDSEVYSIEEKYVRTENDRLNADIVLISTGVVPETSLAVKAGVRLGSTGAIAVDSRMETSQEGIFAAGDCVETFNIINNRKLFLPLGTLANKQGRVAGTNAANGYMRFPGCTLSSELELFGYEIARTGLSYKESLESGFEPVEIDVTVPSAASGMKERSPILIYMVGDKKTGRILGVEMMGRTGVAHRINIAATAIINGNTAEEMSMFDFAYAPPFSPVWDPLHVSSNVLSKECRKF